jgi:hypothetical protein
MGRLQLAAVDGSFGRVVRAAKTLRGVLAGMTG